MTPQDDRSGRAGADAAALVRALIESMRGARDDWASLALVVDLRGGRVGGTHGYAYSPDGTVSAVASRPSGVASAVEAYLAASFTPEQERSVAFLVQVDRATGEYDVTFEDTDPARWKVTPRNIDELAEALRPKLD